MNMGQGHITSRSRLQL